MNHYFAITDHSDHSMRLHIAAHHRVYQGHFPNHPICPGVLTMQMMRRCVELQEGRALQWSDIKNCRFTAMLYPDDHIQVQWSDSRDEGKITIKGVIRKIVNDLPAEEVLSITATLT